jgi:L-glyceraldehyde 3-phosphate reductase
VAGALLILRSMGTPLLIHQPSYNMLNRWIEDDGLLDVLEAEGAGCIVFSPLAQGVLFGKYLTGIPEGSRATHSRYLSPDQITKEALAKVRALGAIAEKRGQALAQMALAWTLRDPRVTSAVIGVSSIAQLEENRAALEHGEFSSPELEEIDRALSS